MLSVTKNNWPFDQPPNCAVFTTWQVLDGLEPIVHVSHDADDHGWQFLGISRATLADARIVSLKEIVSLDPTILQIADIPPGGTATREQANGEWKKSKPNCIVPVEP